MLSTFFSHKPWRGLIRRLAQPLPPVSMYLLLFYTILVPTLVISGIHVPVAAFVLLNLFALYLFRSISTSLHSGQGLFSIQSQTMPPISRWIISCVLKVSAFVSTIFLTYLVIILSMKGLQLMTGIEHSQDMPDLSSLSLKNIVFKAITAGITEEIWRFSFIILFLIACRKISGVLFDKTPVRIIALFVSVLLSSVVFGWLHSFGYSELSFSFPITIQLGVMGMILCSISLLTRRLWLGISFHAFHDLIVMILLVLTERFESLEALSFISGFGLFFFTCISLLIIGFLCLIISFFLLRFLKGFQSFH